MCEFISWIERDGAVVFLTGRDLKTSRGKAMRERIGDDVCGHGAIREYWDIAPGVGTERECDDFSTPDNFPALIVDAIKNGEFRGIGIAEDLLTPEALSGYRSAAGTAMSEYESVTDAARAEYSRVFCSSWAECDRGEAAAWSEYDRIRSAARNEYRRVEASAFWDLFANPNNRPEAWR